MDLSVKLGSKTLKSPIWVSSMTGGTEKALMINQNLAQACKIHGLGMGLGSCRSLLFDNDRLSDFAMRKHIGDQPLYANLGIAQVAELIEQKKLNLITDMVNKLEADGLIIHVNPLQEWMQPEGDRYQKSPLELIETVLEECQIPLIIKEVGQGMGRKSIKSLLDLPLVALDFAAYGGTNFSKLELLRGSAERKENMKPMMFVGHTAEEMLSWTNDFSFDPKLRTKTIIISGGIKDFLDGYYFTKKSKLNSIYGHASKFLKYALLGEESLNEFIEFQVEGLKTAHALLDINPAHR